MQWLPCHLLSLCLSGALLLAVCWGREEYGDYEYEVGPTADYDENHTIPFSIFSNTSKAFDLEEIIRGGPYGVTEKPEEPEEPEEEDEDHRAKDKASPLASPGLLLCLCLLLHQLSQLL